MILCNSCLYQFDIRHCCPPDFGEVVQCNGYVGMIHPFPISKIKKI